MKGYNCSDMRQQLGSQVGCGLPVFCVQDGQVCHDLSLLSSVILFRPLQEIDCLALWKSEYG
jgi:hypothetical protein